MNRYTRDLIIMFTDDENISRIRRFLAGKFKNPRADAYLRSGFESAVGNFATSIEREFADSEPIGGSTIYDELELLNKKFAREQVALIQNTICEEGPAEFTVEDGRPTTRLGSRMTADEMLESWKYARRQPQFRDDPYEHGTVRNDMGGRENSGITFCDQSRVGLQNHINQYENTSSKLALNKSLPYEETVFGVDTAAATARLVSRRVYRSEAGVENGVPMMRQKMHSRHNDRDVDETMYRGFGNHVRGFDMRSLYARVDSVKKRAPPVRPDLRVYPGDKSRYTQNCQ